eukprot:TRINITY_DN2343_c0_g1_i2.p1 TRINITY_DN2343_c0_g1~~TRINITY_DN2343_c0_g1_i2.p1  ORF type:complete len:744 (-),score=170.88 TRINITY_DN2343_c0_g1_i2:88-2241(-)
MGNRYRLAFVCLFLFLSVSLSAWTSKSNRKQLAGPPDEFSLHSLPLSSSVGVDTFNDVSYIFFAEDNTDEEKLKWNGTVQVDSSEAFSFAITSPFLKNLVVTLLSPQNNPVPLPKPTMDKLRLGDGASTVDLTTWLFNNSLPTGNYTILLSGRASEIKDFRAQRRRPYFLFGLIPDGLVLTWNKSPLSLYSHLLDYNLLKGKKIGLRAMFKSEASSVTNLKYDVDERELDIELPNGTTLSLTMQDDGLHDDLEANDGVYGASLIAPLSGIYVAKPVLRAKSNGVEVRRSSVHIITVVEESLELTGLAWMKKTDENLLGIYIEVQNSLNVLQNQTFRPYAELWGWTFEGESEVEIPICWLSTITHVETFQGKNTLALQLDPKWVRRVNAFGPFTLRNVYVQETNYYTPILQGQEVRVKAGIKDDLDITTLLQEIKFDGQITREMREGVRPPPHVLRVLNKNIFKPTFYTDEELQSSSTVLNDQDSHTSPRTMIKNDNNSGKLVLVHGYCSDTNPWEKSGFNWTNPAYFLNPSASITNDLFARKIMEFTSDFLSFSLIAHSQGGLASTHLHNYYFTGLEFAEGGRLIQSVGSPYKGNTLAGALALIGEVFGIGCGPNVDLSRDGAELWLRGISNQTRKDVHYFTTTYKPGSFFGSYCVLGENYLILVPNDGTAELPLTELEGGNNMGNTPGWCHTEDMTYPAQTNDESRNSNMNSMAAR